MNYDEMVKCAYEEIIGIEKTAKTRMQKMIEAVKWTDPSSPTHNIGAGKWSESALNRMYQKQKIKDTLNNRINAKAKRFAEGKRPEVMTLGAYQRAEKVDNLPKTIMNSKSERELKFQGHKNSKIVSALREDAKLHGGEMMIRRKEKNPLIGSSEVGYYNGDPYITDMNISLPGKRRRFVGLPKFTARELRGETASHEIDREATRQTRLMKAIDNAGYQTNRQSIGTFKFNDHMTPEVVVGDGKFVKKLSPFAQKRFAQKNKNNDDTGLNLGGIPLDESQAINALRMETSPTPIKNRSSYVMGSYFEKKPPTKDEMNRMMQYLGEINAGENNKGAVKKILDEYNRTPFFKTR